jgi:tryptophan synthase alpha subunit
VTPAAGVLANRLDRGFASGGPGLICYLPLGDPLAVDALAERYVEGGVDVLEIGVPAANPYLDGPLVRASMARALAAGMTLERIAEETARLREQYPEQAMIWMGYGAWTAEDDVVRLAAATGVDGVLFPEPARWFTRMQERLAAADVHLLQFLLRDAGPLDVEHARTAGGYLMLQAVGGATGTGTPDGRLPDSSGLIQRIREAGVRAPIALGVGISTPDQVRAAVGMGADAAIVGTTVLQAALDGADPLRRTLRELRRAVR